MNSTVARAGSQFSPIRPTVTSSAAGMSAGTGSSASSSTKYPASSPVVLTISSRRPGQATLASIFSMMESGSVMSVPPHSVPGSATWK